MHHPAISSRRFLSAALLLVSSTFAGSLAAQQQAAPAPAATPPSSATSSPITNEPPALPVEQIIQKFGDRELEFKKERDNYTYTQTFVVQTIDMDGRADGEYRMTCDILFTPDGRG